MKPHSNKQNRVEAMEHQLLHLSVLVSEMCTNPHEQSI